MLLFKLLAKTALALALIGFGAGIIGASGCGSYVPHEPQTPDIEQPGETPGTEPEQPDPEEPEESNYVNTSLTICDTLTSTYYFEYEGELNAVHVKANNVSANARIYINQLGKGNYDFEAGTSYRITVSGNAPTEWQCWVGQLQRPIDSFTIEDSVAEFTLTRQTAYIFAAFGDNGTFDVDFTLTLQTT